MPCDLGDKSAEGSSSCSPIYSTCYSCVTSNFVYNSWCYRGYYNYRGCISNTSSCPNGLISSISQCGFAGTNVTCSMCMYIGNWRPFNNKCLMNENQCPVEADWGTFSCDGASRMNISAGCPSTTKESVCVSTPGCKLYAAGRYWGLEYTCSTDLCARVSTSVECESLARTFSDSTKANFTNGKCIFMNGKCSFQTFPSTSLSSSSSSSSSSLTTGALVGIVAGAIIILIAASILVRVLLPYF